MGNKENIFDLIASKVSEDQVLADNDWKQIERKYKRSIFFRWSWNTMNIYNLSVITITALFSYLFVEFPNLDDNKNNDIEIQKTTPVSTKTLKNNSDTTCNIIINKTTKPVIFQLEREKHEKDTEGISLKKTAIDKPNLSNTSGNSKKASHSTKDSEINEKTIEVENQQPTEFKPSPSLSVEEKKTEEVIINPKPPVIIYQHDTIFEIDSMKVSRKKMRKMNH